MLGKSTLLVLSLLSTLGFSLPAEAPQPSLPALTTPIQCREGPSLASSLKKEYTTLKDFYSSLPDLDQVPEDDNQWLETDDSCFISAENTIQAIPIQLLSESKDGSLQERWVVPAIAVAIKGGHLAYKGWKAYKAAKKVTKVTKKIPKKKPKKPKVCKRDGKMCNALVKAKSLTRERFKQIKELKDKKFAEVMDQEEKYGKWDLDLFQEMSCLSKIVTLEQRHGFDVMNLMISGAFLSPKKNHVDFGKEKPNQEVQKQLKELYEDYGVTKPSFEKFMEETSDFLQHCKGGKIPTK
jgi:hypothetical protein